MGKNDAEKAGSSAGVRASLHPRGSRGLEKIERAKEPKSALVGLMAYLVPFRAAIVVVLALVAASTVLSLLGPYLMGVAIDRFIALKKTEGLARIALLMLAAYLMTNFCQAAASWIMARVSQDALRRIRGELFQHLQALPLRFFDGNSTGELMSRLTNDIDAINQAVSQNVVSFVASILSMAGILVAMFVLDRWLALASVLVVPVMFGFTRFIARHTRKRFQDLQKQLGELNAVAEESISGGKLVKAFGRKDSTFEAFASANAEVWRAGISANTYALLLMPLTNVLGNFFVIVLASLGGWLALKGLVTAGIIATFINYGQNFIQPLRQVANLYNTIQAALAGAERVFAVLGTSPEIDEGAGSAPVDSIRGDVRFENVTFGYEKGRPIIRNMSFEANSGETIALVGPTGAGKTTLINLLMRFYETDSGRILLDGRDIREIGKADLRRHLGLVLQDTFLFQASVMENIRFGRLDAGDSEVIEAAKVTGADFFIRQLPRGYRTILSESGSNLSQGQRQLLSISRAVLADPGILILDEATSNVDTRTELQLQKALGDLLEGRTSFVIAHRLSTIREADQVLVVDNGEIVEKGTHKELLARKGIYHRLYLSQFKGLEI